MKTVLLPNPNQSLSAWFPRQAKSFLKTALFKKLSQLKHGLLEFHDGPIVHQFGTPNTGLQCKIEVLDDRFYPLIALEGTVGAGEAYILGYWKCSDLTSLIRFFTQNRSFMVNFESGLAKISTPLLRAYHTKRKNTLAGSSKNIEAHYDLGNDFFSLFLDETMTYSCGIFENASSTMKEASIAKNERICKKLDIQATDHILEIGSGWGGFAIHAAQTRGCKVTTITISKAQFDYARERIQNSGLSDKITILLQDYRTMSGQFDKLVSVEMIEAVGHEFYANFFETCSKLLKPNGTMLLQAITIADQIYEEAKKNVDFIQRFIFPGSCIPSIVAISSIVAAHTDLNMIHLEDITPNYPKTLRAWLNQMNANRDKIIAAGYSPEMLRMWEFYLCYCEGGFMERTIGDVHILFAKPGWRGQAPLGQLS